MLFELIVFAVVLVALQGLMGFVVAYLAMKKYTDPKYLKEQAKMMAVITKEIAEELLEEDEL